MVDNQIHGGAFLLARKLFDSKIWLQKPSSWKVIWIYILGKVSHKDNGHFKRGEGYFNFSQEKNQIGLDISDDMIKKCMGFLRQEYMIDTTRSTRGTRLKVLNYNDYQLLDSYESTTRSTREAREKHERSTPIYKNVRIKELKNSNKDIYMDFVFLTKEEHTKLITKFGPEITQEKIERLNNYIGSKGKKYASHYHTILSWDKKNTPEEKDNPFLLKRPL